MMDERSADKPYEPEDLVKHYSLSAQESIRTINQFGADRQEIDLLLGHRTSDVPSNADIDHTRNPDFLFDI